MKTFNTWLFHSPLSQVYFFIRKCCLCQIPIDSSTTHNTQHTNPHTTYKQKQNTYTLNSTFYTLDSKQSLLYMYSLLFQFSSSPENIQEENSQCSSSIVADRAPASPSRSHSHSLVVQNKIIHNSTLRINCLKSASLLFLSSFPSPKYMVPTI